MRLPARTNHIVMLVLSVYALSLLLRGLKQETSDFTINTVVSRNMTFNPSILPLLQGYYLISARADTGKKWQGPHSLFLSLNMEESNPNDIEGPKTMKQLGYVARIEKDIFKDYSVVECKNTGTGPEDGRLFYTKEGAPMLQFTGPPLDNDIRMETNCHIMWIVDVRTIFSLKGLLQNEPPIIYSKPTPLQREGVSDLTDKNWVALPSPVHNLIYNINSEGPPTPRLFTVDPTGVVRRYLKDWTTSCLQRYVQEPRIHQTTQALRITLCNRGECTENRRNTIYMSIIQGLIKDQPKGHRIYVPYVLTYNMDETFSFRSLSKPIHWSNDMLSNSSSKYWWYTHSMQWKNLHEGDPTHGYVNDDIIVSGGITDKENWYIVLKANILLRDHDKC